MPSCYHRNSTTRLNAGCSPLLSHHQSRYNVVWSCVQDGKKNNFGVKNVMGQTRIRLLHSVETKLYLPRRVTIAFITFGQH